MDIQDTKEQRQAFEAWCIQWNIASVFPLDDEGQYSDYNIHLLYCAWLQGQAAKAQAVPEVKDIGNELQSWVAVWSFKARHDHEDYIVVDANLLAEKIEKLTGANA